MIELRFRSRGCIRNSDTRATPYSPTGRVQPPYQSVTPGPSSARSTQSLSSYLRCLCFRIVACPRSQIIPSVSRRSQRGRYHPRHPLSAVHLPLSSISRAWPARRCTLPERIIPRPVRHRGRRFESRHNPAFRNTDRRDRRCR